MRNIFLLTYLQYYSRGRSNFQENAHEGLPGVSKLIDSAISKRQEEDKGNTVFSREKSTPWKGKWIHYEHPEISHHLMDCAMKQSTHQFHKILFHISRCSACNAEKTLQMKITKKIMNISNIINIYTNI